MAKILVLPSEVVDKAESGNIYAFPADNIIMSDKATSVEEAINNKPGEKIPGTEEDSVGGEIFNDYTNNIASGVGSHAEGAYTTASGVGSHAEGAVTIASGAYSHAEGYGTTASKMCSHAEGSTTTASGEYSHAEGSYTIAASGCQHVQGQYNVEDSEGIYAHIVGWGTSSSARANIHTITTGGDGWFAGKVSTGTVETPSEPTEANDLITKKYFDENSGSGVGQLYPNEVDEETNPVGAPGEIFNVYEDSEELPGIKKNIASGAYSHAEGAATTASGTTSHVEGATTTASGMSSHAEGLQTTASGDGSHAEGFQTTASGDGSHAEGLQTTASGKYSHAEGYETTASGEYSHAEGIQTTASVLGSHAEGANTTASGDYQHVQGKWNIEDTESKYAHIVGWGTSSTSRANIHTITTSGDGWFAGKVSAGTVDSPAEPTADNDLITKKYFDDNSNNVGEYYPGTVDEEMNPAGIGGEIFNAYEDSEDIGVTKNIASGGYSHAECISTTASGMGSHAEGATTTASGTASHAEGINATASGMGSHAEGAETTASGYMSHSEGNLTTASGQISHAEGNSTKAYGNASHAEGYKTIAGDQKLLCNYCHAEGDQTTASGEGSHAEGSFTTASGVYSHAEGNSTIASGEGSHAEGFNSEASGAGSHAEGFKSEASGESSHAEGYYTIASSNYQHVQGRFNIEDSGGTYVHIVGWGTSISNRKNIHTISTSGDGWFAGKVSAGTVDTPAEPVEANDLITKKYFDDNVGSSGGGGEQGITNVIVHTTSVGPTMVGSFGNLTQLPSGYTYDNTIILGFYISTDSSIYFGGSCHAFNIRITNTNYIQINIINNTYQQELAGASIRFILANINLPTGTSLTN